MTESKAAIPISSWATEESSEEENEETSLHDEEDTSEVRYNSAL